MPAGGAGAGNGSARGEEAGNGEAALTVAYSGLLC